MHFQEKLGENRWDVILSICNELDHGKWELLCSFTVICEMYKQFLSESCLKMKRRYDLILISYCKSKNGCVFCIGEDNLLFVFLFHSLFTRSQQHMREKLGNLFNLSAFHTFKDVCMYSTWAWTAVGLLDFLYYKHLSLVCFIPTSTRGSVCNIFHLFQISSLFVMLKFPLKMQTAICHTSIFNRKKLQKRFLADIRSLLPFFQTQTASPHTETKPLHQFSSFLLEMTIFRCSDGFFCVCFIKCTSLNLSKETRSTRAMLANGQTWLWNE